MFAVIFLK